MREASGLRQLKASECSNVGALFLLHVVSYNLVCSTNLLRARYEVARMHRSGTKINGNQDQANVGIGGKHTLIRLDSCHPDLLIISDGRDQA